MMATTVGYMRNISICSSYVILTNGALTNDAHMGRWKDIPNSSLFAVLDFLCSPLSFLTDIYGNFTAEMILMLLGNRTSENIQLRNSLTSETTVISLWPHTVQPDKQLCPTTPLTLFFYLHLCLRVSECDVSRMRHWAWLGSENCQQLTSFYFYLIYVQSNTRSKYRQPIAAYKHILHLITAECSSTQKEWAYTTTVASTRKGLLAFHEVVRRLWLLYKYTVFTIKLNFLFWVKNPTLQHSLRRRL